MISRNHRQGHTAAPTADANPITEGCCCHHCHLQTLEYHLVHHSHDYLNIYLPLLLDCDLLELRDSILFPQFPAPTRTWHPVSRMLNEINEQIKFNFYILCYYSRERAISSCMCHFINYLFINLSRLHAQHWVQHRA